MPFNSKTTSKLNDIDIAERAICNGSVVLFQRKNSKRWQARIRRNIGEWVIYSTNNIFLNRIVPVTMLEVRKLESQRVKMF